MSDRTTAILIGDPVTLERLEKQLALLAKPPVIIGWILTSGSEACGGTTPVLGTIDELEAIASQRQPGVALLSLPAVLNKKITTIRTRLRRLGIPDRFLPTLEDQIAGIGPRTYLEIDPAVLLDRPDRVVTGDAIHTIVKARRVLITGAGGSIGSELARIVATHAPAHLALMDRSENALFEIDRQIARRAPTLPRAALLHDVVDADGTLAHCKRLQPEIVIHAAAHKHVGMMEAHPRAAIDNNLFGTKSVADAAHAVGAERFVMISTDKAVNPTSIMGATKRLAELYVQGIGQRSTATAFLMVRFGNVLGSAGSVLEIWAKQIADGGPITVTDPRMTRYFMTIPEAATLVLESAALVDLETQTGEVFLLDMGEPVPIVEMAKRYVRMHGLEPVVGTQATGTVSSAGVMPIVMTGARPGEKIHEELAFDAESLLPTRHPAIKTWRLPPPDAAFVDRMVRELDPAHRPSNPDELATALRQLVPEMATPLAA